MLRGRSRIPSVTTAKTRSFIVTPRACPVHRAASSPWVAMTRARSGPTRRGNDVAGSRARNPSMACRMPAIGCRPGPGAAPAFGRARTRRPRTAESLSRTSSPREGVGEPMGVGGSGRVVSAAGSSRELRIRTPVRPSARMWCTRTRTANRPPASPPTTSARHSGRSRGSTLTHRLAAHVATSSPAGRVVASMCRAGSNSGSSTHNGRPSQARVHSTRRFRSRSPPTRTACWRGRPSRSVVPSVRVHGPRRTARAGPAETGCPGRPPTRWRARRSAGVRGPSWPTFRVRRPSTRWPGA